ncbi:sigma-E processing peptidase SpoIIGA [Anaeromicropila herbilytica]|uniref:Sporulation sigma-E factor-processing peptidase n=1 Tax=Anaeromicropila herbilytica TaxID=2785025 RepID=A0A7R7IDA4_9FIRM|nr:sigma-E processing peptidase SpoIIGA [Anaeromicropila herbilytica]BCN31548.1 sporulation sigma-E factor-processing peptidase [Anaeromicropila herbilytica]
MYLEIYADTLFLINFCMDVFLLIGVKKVLGLSSKWYRIVLAATVGSVLMCIMAIFPYLNLMIKIVIMYLIATTLMVVIAFSYKNFRNTLKEVLMLFIVTFFIGGILNSIYYYTDLGFYFRELLNGRLYMNRNIRFYISGIIALLLVLKLVIPYLVHRKDYCSNLYDVEITFCGLKQQGIGFFDTGNELYDPFTRKPVLLANYTFMDKLFDVPLKEYLKAYYKAQLNESYSNTSITIEYADKIKFIPFHSVGKKNGILIAVVCDEIKIINENETKTHENVIIAIYDGELSTKDDYQIILHKELL